MFVNCGRTHICLDPDHTVESLNREDLIVLPLNPVSSLHQFLFQRLLVVDAMEIFCKMLILNDVLVIENRL